MNSTQMVMVLAIQIRRWWILRKRSFIFDISTAFLTSIVAIVEPFWTCLTFSCCSSTQHRSKWIRSGSTWSSIRSSNKLSQSTKKSTGMIDWGFLSILLNIRLFWNSMQRNQQNKWSIISHLCQPWWMVDKFSFNIPIMANYVPIQPIVRINRHMLLSHKQLISMKQHKKVDRIVFYASASWMYYFLLPSMCCTK